tara:strand:- start:432 stop:1022 length:591 start_codon:yes stop_codon:yes gene_type:complete
MRAFNTNTGFSCKQVAIVKLVPDTGGYTATQSNKLIYPPTELILPAETCELLSIYGVGNDSDGTNSFNNDGITFYFFQKGTTRFNSSTSGNHSPNISADDFVAMNFLGIKKSTCDSGSSDGGIETAISASGSTDATLFFSGGNTLSGDDNTLDNPVILHSDNAERKVFFQAACAGDGLSISGNTTPITFYFVLGHN